MVISFEYIQKELIFGEAGANTPKVNRVVKFWVLVDCAHVLKEVFDFFLVLWRHTFVSRLFLSFLYHPHKPSS